MRPQKTGLLRHAKVTPRVISNEKPDEFKVTFLDHAGEDVYKFRDSSLVITVGDDTTLISSDILYRFDIPVIGITDGDLDKVVEDGFKVKDSIIFEVESGFDDIIGQNIKREIFNGKAESLDFKNIDEVESKIVEIIKNIDVKEVLDRQIEYNMAISLEGLNNNYGANIGKTILKQAFAQNKTP